MFVVSIFILVSVSISYLLSFTLSVIDFCDRNYKLNDGDDSYHQSFQPILPNSNFFNWLVSLIKLTNILYISLESVTSVKKMRNKISYCSISVKRFLFSFFRQFQYIITLVLSVKKAKHLSAYCHTFHLFQKLLWRIYFFSLFSFY